VIATSVKSFFNDNYDEKKKTLEEQLRQLKPPVKLILARPSQKFNKGPENRPKKGKID
jgi:hypothetical protein